MNRKLTRTAFTRAVHMGLLSSKETQNYSTASSLLSALREEVHTITKIY